MVDDDVAGGFRAVDVHIGIAAHVSHTGAAEHLAGRILQRLIGAFRPHANIAGMHGDLCAALYLAFVAAAIHVTANLDLPLRHYCGEEYQNQYGDNSLHSQFSTLNVGLSRSGSDST